MSDSLPKVDVAIPVYNAPEETKRCIDLLFQHAGHRVSGVFVHDDCSQKETADMLDCLDYPMLDVVHGETNGGFASSMNRAINRTSTEYILALNSDVIPRDDFIAPLLDVMIANPDIGALNVGGEPYYRKNFDHYDQGKGYVCSHDLSGYAFIIRRSAWEQVEGFDTAYGRGYYEDTDMARRLIKKGWKLGIHAGTYLGHKNHASFEGVDGIPEVYKQNRKRYLERYPEVHKRILIIGSERLWSDLPQALHDDLELIFNDGGKAYWFNVWARYPLPCPEVKLFKLNLGRLVRQVKRKSAAPIDNPVEIWTTPSLSMIQKFIVKRLKTSYSVTIKIY